MANHAWRRLEMARRASAACGSRTPIGGESSVGDSGANPDRAMRSGAQNFPDHVGAHEKDAGKRTRGSVSGSNRKITRHIGKLNKNHRIATASATMHPGINILTARHAGLVASC
ncbi:MULTISPECIES: hypothetical protein [unclassified Burkholderia]|uniref:hypothetical protein n=1 Tax=unclassified Burkholderia TaxID=2613784 RepID=UPI000F567E6F|nr:MULTISPECIES: hypothetical protein [unclassified Burkholderia]